MEIKSNPSVNFVWQNRQNIGLAVCYGPLLFEGGKCLAQLAYNPKNIQEKACKAKNYFISFFTRSEGESRKGFYLRLIKNIAINAAVLSLFSGLIAGSIFFLPTSMTIGVALTAIFSLGNIFLNAEDFSKGFNDKIARAKKCFTIQKEKPLNNEILRITKNIVCAAIVTAAGLGLVSLIAYIITQIALGTVSIWTSYNLLPFQTPAGVFLEYAVVGSAHGALAARYAYKNKKGTALFHLVNGVMSFVFPTLMLQGYPAEPMRLHHSFLGLALALIPYRPIQMLASVITMDSVTNSFYRQYAESISHQYDFQNILVHERTDAITNTIAASALQDFSSRIPNT